MCDKATLFDLDFMIQKMNNEQINQDEYVREINLYTKLN